MFTSFKSGICIVFSEDTHVIAKVPIKKRRLTPPPGNQPEARSLDLVQCFFVSHVTGVQLLSFPIAFSSLFTLIQPLEDDSVLIVINRCFRTDPTDSPGTFQRGLKVTCIVPGDGEIIVGGSVVRFSA